MHYDEIPSLPVIKNEELHEIEQEQALSEFTVSSCKFMFYESSNGATKTFFHKLDAPLYAAMVANLCSLQNSKVYEFLKLVLEGARLMKQQTKKGLEMAVKIESYFKEKSRL